MNEQSYILSLMDPKSTTLFSGMPYSIFFRPRKEFLDWFVKESKGHFVYDVGAGVGYLEKCLREAGKTDITSIDNISRDRTDSLVRIANACTYNYMPSSIVLICRPSHGPWVGWTINQAYRSEVSRILYIGKLSNLERDLHGFYYKIVFYRAGEDDEVVCEIPSKESLRSQYG